MTVEGEDVRLEGRTVIIKRTNGNGNERLTKALLWIVLGVFAFLGIQVWMMNERLVRVETNLQTLVAQGADQE